MKNYFKNRQEKGITLIALVITIIILVILAAVSIRAAFNSGIIEYSISGTQKYIEGADNENSLLIGWENYLESALKSLEEEEEEEESDVPDLLRKYVLGADEQGKDIYSILNKDPNTDDYYKFKNDQDSIEDARTSVIYLNEQNGNQLNGYPGILSNVYYTYIKYDNAGYRIEWTETTIEDDPETEEWEYQVVNKTRDVVKVYEPSGHEGEIVSFKAKTTDESADDWVVLYDDGTYLDITPLGCIDEVGVELGEYDEAVPGSIEDQGEICLWSYNHAVDTINAYCDSLIDNPLALRVRSLGTGFNVPSDVDKLENESNLYSSEFLASFPEGSPGGYNARALNPDLDSEADLVRLSYFGRENPADIYQARWRICQLN